MRMLWNKPKPEQLDPVEGASELSIEPLIPISGAAAPPPPPSSSADEPPSAEGLPLLASVSSVQEDLDNPRTEFPDAEIAELAEDIAVRGILQPIVVRQSGGDACYRVVFGAKRLRAARRAGLESVPVVLASKAHDAYAQVAENQKRHGLTPLDLARFIRSRVDAGESNAEIAKRMGTDQTTVAHQAPRVALRAARKVVAAPRTPALVDRAGELCARLESLLAQIKQPEAGITSEELGTLRKRLADLATW